MGYLLIRQANCIWFLQIRKYTSNLETYQQVEVFIIYMEIDTEKRY